MSQQESHDRSIVLYTGKDGDQGPLELVHPENIAIGGKERWQIDELVIGNSGIIGFLTVDRAPESRDRSYTDVNMQTFPPAYREDDSWKWGDDPTRRAHYINTEDGFKLIRFFALPQDVTQLFRGDRFLGEGMIRKCLEEGVPDEIDEEPSNPEYAFTGFLESWLYEPDEVTRLLTDINPDLAFEEYPGRLSPDVDRRAYVSFHPWEHLEPAKQFGKQAIYEAVRRVDEVVKRFDTQQSVRTRGLELEGTSIVNASLLLRWYIS